MTLGVHRFMRLELCPSCRRLYKEVQEEACWRCTPLPVPDGEPVNPDDARGAVAHWRESRAERIAEDAIWGEVGSLEGLGFAPIMPNPGPPPVPDEEAGRWFVPFIEVIAGIFLVAMLIQALL